MALARKRVRSYALYVSATREQADKHVETIAAMLESEAIATDDPGIGQRMLGKYGHSRGWRRNRLRTASGFTVDALGLDVAARGIKVEGQRPDLIILDDIDAEDDTPEATDKKIRTLTQKILPSGTSDVAILAIQNVVIPDGVFARLGRVADEPADFLHDREVSGPIPAITDLEYEEADGHVMITAGTPTWKGMDIAACERIIATEGLSAFLSERQHLTRQRGAKLFAAAWWDGQHRYDYDDATLIRQTEARYMYWDTAEEEGDRNAYTACVVFDLVPYQGNYAALVRDVWRDRIDSTRVMDVIEERAELWHAALVGRDILQNIVVEYASSGKHVVKTARRSTSPLVAERLLRFTPRDSKDARAIAAAMHCRAGRVWLPRPHPDAPWLTMFLAELLAVPQSTYRDMADAFAMGCIGLSDALAVQHEREEAA